MIVEILIISIGFVRFQALKKYRVGWLLARTIKIIYSNMLFAIRQHCRIKVWGFRYCFSTHAYMCSLA
jgi:Ni,Fe-hydrogenase I cytochrome b subunit